MPDFELFQRAVIKERSRKRRSQIIGFMVATLLLIPVGMTLATFGGFSGTQRLLLAPVIMAVVLGAGLVIVKGIQWLAGRVFTAFVAPGGRARGASGHSRAQALAASGRIDEAAAEFDALRGSDSESMATLQAEAELHSRPGGDPKRAEDSLLRMRRDKRVTPAVELYASHRLIDLYMGALNDQGRAVVELRRMADRFPGTPDGKGARDALKQRRELDLFGAHDGIE